MDVNDCTGFRSMARDYPVRTALFTAGPLLVAATLLLNTYLHGASTPVAAGYGALLLGYSALVNQYHLTTYKRRTVTREALNAD